MRYSLAGSAGAVVGFCLSLTPSLLPRGPVLQGLVGGVAAAIGYSLAVLAVWLLRQTIPRPLPRSTRTVWRWFGAVAAVVVAVHVYLGAQWQAEIHRLMGLPTPHPGGSVVIVVLATATAAGLVGLIRLLRRLARWIATLLGRWIRPPAARVLAATLVIVLTAGVLNGVVIDGLLAATDRAFRTVNAETRPDVSPPTSPLRSGGPGSLVPWASLGNEGRTFVAGGPDREALRRFTGIEPREPIRVYAGLESASTSRERAALAVQELERTGAFERRVLCVVTTTGTGWVDRHAMDPLEYMYGGDTALVSLQYSYLPSWLSFLVDKERAREAGRDLFNQVYGVWSRLPADQRPRLLAFGESLGSFGAESPFSGADDMRNRVDGMLLVGPPNRNERWREFVADRDPGTTQALPTYERGATVRFADDPADLGDPAGWSGPRVAYLQHASDPIVWWTPRLLFTRPDWLTEPRGEDVSPRMRWLPIVTFWQVTGDLAFSTGVPEGHGHRYGSEAVAAWAVIAPPAGWTADRTAALTGIVAAGG